MKHVIRSLSYVIRVLAEFQQFCQAEFPAILAALLLFVFFVLREEFASLFQTFSRSDPPGKAPLTRGRYVFQKKNKEKRGEIADIGTSCSSTSAFFEHILMPFSEKVEKFRIRLYFLDSFSYFDTI